MFIRGFALEEGAALQRSAVQCSAVQKRYVHEPIDDLRIQAQRSLEDSFSKIQRQRFQAYFTNRILRRPLVAAW